MSGDVLPETIDDEFGSTSDDEFEAEEEAWGKFLEQGLSPDFMAQFKNIQAQFETWDNATEDELDARLTFDNQETTVASLPKETVPTQDQAYVEIADTTAAQKDAVGDQDRAARSKMRLRVALILFSVVIAEALLIYLLKVKHGTPAPSGDFKQADADAAEAMLDNWRGRPDPAFWTAIAGYVEKAPQLSLQTQMVMMGYIKNWAPSDPITWGPTEKSDDIPALANAVTAARPGDIYRQVITIQHNGAPLQRAVAADLCENALAQVLAKAQAGGQS